MSKSLTSKKVMFTFVLFMTIWTLRVYIFSPYINSNLKLWDKEVVNGTIKSVIWVGFAIYFIKLYDKNLIISLKEMFATKIKSKILLPISGAFMVFYVITMFVMHKGLYLNPSFHPSQLIGQFILVGILEEIVFRGWFFNALSTPKTFRKANVISSIMFVLIHVPSWALNGTSILTMLFMGSNIFILSMIFGWSFQKNRSLWTPIILHMIWDLFSITVV